MSTLTPAAPRKSGHARSTSPTAPNTGSRRSIFGKFGGKSRMDPTRNNTAAGVAAWLLALLFAARSCG
jgi:sorbitol/mannitol transport system permease protein